MSYPDPDDYITFLFQRLEAFEALPNANHPHFHLWERVGLAILLRRCFQLFRATDTNVSASGDVGKCEMTTRSPGRKIVANTSVIDLWPPHCITHAFGYG